jgi:hypothetical protein
MGRRSRRRQKNDNIKETPWAKAAVFMLLVNIFVLAGLRNIDKLVITLVVAVVAGIGWVFAIRAQRQLRRYHGRLQGDGLAALGYWGNLLMMLFFLLGFAWFLAMGILRGELI